MVSWNDALSWLASKPGGSLVGMMDAVYVCVRVYMYVSIYIHICEVERWSAGMMR
jgi:hypothetical protein